MVTVWTRVVPLVAVMSTGYSPGGASGAAVTLRVKNAMEFGKFDVKVALY